MEILKDKPEKVDLRQVVLQLNSRLSSIEITQRVIQKDLQNAQIAVASDIVEIRRDLAEHIRRTAANEQRIKIMEAHVKGSKEHVQTGFDALLESQDKTLETLVKMQREERKSGSKNLQISIGIFAAVATLVTALAAWLSNS